MKRPIQFPELKRWEKRPYFQGFPIPFTTLIDDQGIPNFQAVDGKNIIRCLVDRLCGICGTKMAEGAWIAFIGGELCAKNRIFIDPPMHPECAYFAAETCPYLNNSQGNFAKEPSLRAPKDARLYILNEVDKIRPKRMMIYFTKGYDATQLTGRILIEADRKPHIIDWNAMPESSE